MAALSVGLWIHEDPGVASEIITIDASSTVADFSPTFTVGSISNLDAQQTLSDFNQTFTTSVIHAINASQTVSDFSQNYLMLSADSVDFSQTMENFSQSYIIGDTTLGTERWVQPEFNSWTGITTADANWSLGAGVSHSDGGTGALGMTGGSSPLTVGKTYRARIDLLNRTAGTIWYGWNGSNTDYGTASSNGTHTKDFTATATPLYVYSDGYNGDIDNYSVKEITPTPSPPPPPPPPAPPPVGTSTTTADFATWKQNFIPSAPYAWSDSIRNRVVGGGLWANDVLTNLVVGGSGSRQASYRFRAVFTGYVSSLRMYWVGDSPGYGLGDGGIIRMRIYPDSSGIPNTGGTLYGQGTFTPNMSNYVIPGGYMHTTSFSQLNQVTAGNVYHVVFDNIHSNPTQNYISPDCGTVYGDNQPVSHVFYDRDCVALEKVGSGAWTTRDDSYATLTPTCMYTMSGGQQFGVADYAPGNYAQGGSNYLVTSINAEPFREEIIPSSTRTWYGGVIAAVTTTGGYLDWTLKTAGGSELVSGSLYQASANDVATAQATFSRKVAHYPFWFANGVSLTAGQTYYLTFTPRGSSSWRIPPQGSKGEGFDNVGSPELAAQHFRSGSWKYTVNYNHNLSAKICTWRSFYFTS